MQESEIDQSHLFITTAAVQIIEKFMLEIEKSHPAFSLELQWNGEIQRIRKWEIEKSIPIPES